MVERVVTDRERVAACRNLWRSRFDREPSIETIARVTGLDHDRASVRRC